MNSPQLRSARRIWMAVFAVIALALLGGGSWYYRVEAKKIRQENYQAIGAIGELKAGQIQQWRKERLADADRLARGRFLGQAIPDWLREGDRRNRRTDIQDRLELDRVEGGYDNAILLALDGRILFAVGDAPHPLEPASERAIAAALAGPEAVLSDFFRESDGVVHIDAVGAVRDGQGQPVAVAILRSNAEAYLYPLIQSWPTPSRSAETLLVQREGDDVVFLNEPRHRQKVALTLHEPLTRTSLPAAQVVLGRRGPFEGVDYRGAPVLADLRAIPGSPWFMVAKVDLFEILTEARYRAAVISVIVALFILLAAAAIAYGYRQQQAGLFRERYESERQQRKTQEVFRTTLYSIGDAVITTDTEGRVREMNPVAERLTGWSEADAHGRPLEEVFRILDDARAATEGSVTAALRSGATVGLGRHTRLVARDGTERIIADSAAPIRDDSGAVSGVVLVFSDQTVSDAAQRALAESEKRYRALFDNMLNGFAYCRMEHDEQGRPVDFVYLAVNQAFERLTGLRDVVGKPVSAVLPGIRELSPELFEAYDRVASSGIPETFEFDFKLRDQWLTISVYSPARGTFAAVFDDITERKRTEEALRDSEARYRTLAEASEDAIFIVGRDRRLRYVNLAGARYFARDAAELAGVDIADLLPPETFDATNRWVQDVFDGGRARNDIARVPFPTGVRWLDTSMVGLLDAAGRVDSVMGVSRDITERKLAEEALRESEARFRGAFESSAIGMALVGMDRRYLQVNRTMCQITGYSEQELLARTVEDITYPDDVDAAFSRSRALVADETAAYRVEKRYIHKAGHVIWGQLFVTLVRDRQHRPLLLVAQVLDITERKRAEADLRLQSAALNAAANAIVITDPQGTIEWVNPAFSTLTGYDAEEAVGRNPRQLVKSGVHDRAFFKDLWDTILAGHVWHGEVTNRRKDGRLYPEEQTITPVKDAHGEITHFVAIKRDLTQERQLEAQFLQAQKMESVGRLAGGIAHDFNNLLSVINGVAEVASIHLKADDPLRADFEEIRRAGDRAVALTRQLLAFSRKQIMMPTVVNVNALVGDMQAMLQRLIGEDVRFVFRPGAKVGTVRADPGQLEQVMLNVVVNARDAMPDGGTVTCETRNVDIDEAVAAERSFVQPGPHVLLEICDTGVGMDETTRTRIFEPFFTTKEPGKGTGLGLSTVYGIVKQSGGSIEVDSESDRGTTLRIYLPRIGDAPDADQPPQTEAPVRGHETILLVEDELALCRVATRILDSAGYTVVTATTGEEALEKLKHHDGPVHLVLTDVVLPGINGRELASRLAETHPGIKVLYTSGYTDDAILRRGVSDKTTHFISKPYAIDDLTRKVREVLDG